MNSYLLLKERHKQETGDFPFFFAFDNEQFTKGMARFGLTPDETDKIYGLSNVGGAFYLRKDAPRLYEMYARHDREREEAISADSTGDGYIFEMFRHELAKRDFGYTWDVTETLEALGYTMEGINHSESLQHGLDKAIALYRDEE